MNDKELLALMYDFYNKHTLRGQNDDIKYYIEQIKKYNAKNILIIGAGTGRVAIPISEYATVTALDLDKERLELLEKKSSNIKTICINFLDYDIDNYVNFDLIIIPYSTLQYSNDVNNLNLFFYKLKRMMNKNCILLFDLSESFNTKVEKSKELVINAYCDEVKDNVEVYYTSKRHDEYIEFIVEYKLCEKDYSVIEHEKYYYYDKELITDIVNNNGLKILKIDDGYGKEGFEHKHIYHCRGIL